MAIDLNRTDEITFNASVDDMGHVGTVNLGKTKVERLRSTMELTGKYFG